MSHLFWKKLVSGLIIEEADGIFLIIALSPITGQKNI
jgi:hypothetical protein